MVGKWSYNTVLFVFTFAFVWKQEQTITRITFKCISEDILQRNPIKNSWFFLFEIKSMKNKNKTHAYICSCTCIQPERKKFQWTGFRHMHTQPMHTQACICMLLYCKRTKTNTFQNNNNNWRDKNSCFIVFFFFFLFFYFWFKSKFLLFFLLFIEWTITTRQQQIMLQ